MNMLNDDFVLFLVMVAIVTLATVIYALVDLSKQHQMKDRTIWILVILITGFVGALLYFYLAPKQRAI